jgi:hypothetical protein
MANACHVPDISQILADMLGHHVEIASVKLNTNLVCSGAIDDVVRDAMAPYLIGTFFFYTMCCRQGAALTTIRLTKDPTTMKAAEIMEDVPQALLLRLDVQGSCLPCVSLAFFAGEGDLVGFVPIERGRRSLYPYPWLWITWERSSPGVGTDGGVALEISEIAEYSTTNSATLYGK